jgi:hypothetical protein
MIKTSNTISDIFPVLVLPVLMKILFEKIVIIATTICCVFFYKKARTKYKIQIGSKLFVFNEIMALLPYLYLMFTWIII